MSNEEILRQLRNVRDADLGMTNADWAEWALRESDRNDPPLSIEKIQAALHEPR